MSLVILHELEIQESFYGSYGYNTEEQEDRHREKFSRG
jgi:hypothetical protein